VDRRTSPDAGPVHRRRERRLRRWDARGGPGPLVRWLLAAPWRWLLTTVVVTGLVAAFFALTGDRIPVPQVALTATAVLSGLVAAAGLYREWLDRPRPAPLEAGPTRADEEAAPAPATADTDPGVPALDRRVTTAAQVVLVASLAGLVLLTARTAPEPDERAILGALRGDADAELTVLPADEEPSSPAEVSALETGDDAWVVATVDDAGVCHVRRFVDGEVVQRGQARDPAGGCTAEVAADQADDPQPDDSSA
jgi:hypothetical protein